MDTFIVLTLLTLSLLYIYRLFKLKFKYENRKEVVVLQIIIAIISIIAIITGLWQLFIIVFILMIILAISPNKFYNFLKKHFK